MENKMPAKGRPQNLVSHPIWALIAAFGTYFCMYGFRKPYTAATWSNAAFFGVDYKFLLVISQTLGYVIAKWPGIKFVSEILPGQRIKALLLLIFFAEGMLLLFGIVPRPSAFPCSPAWPDSPACPLPPGASRQGWENFHSWCS
jgi:hypothetical protein